MADYVPIHIQQLTKAIELTLDDLIPIGQGDRDLVSASLMQLIQQLNVGNNTAPKPIHIGDADIFNDGVYIPIEEGEYTFLSPYPGQPPLYYDHTEGITWFIKTGDYWIKTVFQVDFTPTGIVAKDDPDAVSGNEVYKFIDENIIPGNNLIETKGNLQSGSYSGNVGAAGAYTPSVNWLCLKPILVDGNIFKIGDTYTLSGLDRMGTTSIRFQFRNASGIVIENILGTGTTNVIPQSFTIPATTVGIYINVSSRSGSGADPANSPLHQTLMLSKGTEIYPYESYGNKLNLKVKKLYMSASGNDAYHGGNKTYAVKTLARAKELLDPEGELILVEGDYYDYDFDFSAFTKITGEPRKRVRFIYGERITVATPVEGFSKVFSYPYTHVGNWLTKYRLWQHDIEDVNTEIQMIDRYTHQNGQKYRLPSTMLQQVTSIAAVQASAIPCYFYDSVAKIMYFQKVDGSSLTANPIIIPKNEGIVNAEEKIVNHSGITIMHKTLFTKNLSGILSRFKIFGTNNGTGAFTTNDTVGLDLVYCEAGGCSNDGFNGATTISSVTNIYNDYTKIRMFDCWAHDCGDDGESHHNHSQVYVYNTLSEYNANGFTAASGCHATYVTCIAQKNTANGFSSQGEPADGGIGTNILTNSCFSDRNNRNYVGRDVDTKYINSISKSPVSGTHFSGTGVKINCVELT